MYLMALVFLALISSPRMNGQPDVDNTTGHHPQDRANKSSTIRIDIDMVEADNASFALYQPLDAGANVDLSMTTAPNNFEPYTHAGRNAPFPYTYMLFIYSFSDQTFPP